MCYENHSHVVLGNTISSDRWVQQGAPLGPPLSDLLYMRNCARQPTTLKGRSPTFRLSTAGLWGTVGSSAIALDFFCKKVVAAFASKGLKVTNSKRELIPTARRNHTIPPHLLEEVPRNLTGNFKLLRPPFGSPDFTSQVTCKRVANVRKTLGWRRRREPRSRCPHHYQEQRGANKLSHSARPTPATQIGPALAELSGI